MNRFGSRFRLPALAPVALAVVGVAALGATLAACGGSDASSGADTSQGEDTTSTTPDTTEAATTVAPTTVPTSSETPTGPTADLGPVNDPAGFELHDRRHFVYDVRSDDTLNVRVDPGATADIVGELAPDTTGVAVYLPVEFVGDDQWLPIAYEGEIRWVAGRFLRPEAAVSVPAEEGTGTDALRDFAATAVEGLTNQRLLATLVGDDGLVVSLDGFVDPGPDGEGDITVSVSELDDPTAEVRVWGYRDGVGDPIALTQDEVFARLAGSTAITSTEVIGFNTIVGAGSTINNIAELFPDADVVEYHFAGTDIYGGLDWESVRFVIQDEVLVAVVADHWTT